MAVLQMANPDVTDQSLESLREMKALRELDLNGSQVTDAGLEILKELPALASLRLAQDEDHGQGLPIGTLCQRIAHATRLDAVLP